MALVLNTNIAALNAQRNLSSTQAQQATTFQRLSTGLRVNSAKDDAAGLYLAQSQTKDIRGLNMATRNASDGISMAQTAEGALDQVSANLQRINELAIQSANGTYNTAARAGLQKEVDQLTSEIKRIVETTEFNGKKLLSTASESSILQIGFNDRSDAQIGVGLEGGLQNQNEIKNTLTFAGADQVFSETSADVRVLAQNAGTARFAEFASGIAGFTSGIEYSYNIAGETITFSAGSTGAARTSAGQAVAATVRPGNALKSILEGGLSEQQTINITTQLDAQIAISQTRDAINVVSEFRATFGAVMNRFEAVISGNNIYSENLSAARSRIQDADFATETSNLAKQQVLQQAGVASLSQANQASQVILGLL
ncbi:MAG: flagellin [Marinospirillum sp.]|uniref:flagellin N-terminal helical domain-containing protein n=1 Tax=Marinospirillum sp. TaxID=2183934 RepID=UPI001A08A974|nr:flagellin [Marinospirillum sp.]MBE0507663.1 flagellin [Marinospirillum sp.]